MSLIRYKWILVLIPIWLTTVPVVATAEEPVLIDTFGQWTIARLGSTQREVSDATNMTMPLATYRLPKHVSQGPETWYRIWLHFRLDLAEHTGPGKIYVSAFTNGFAAAQIRFDVQPMNEGWLIVWRSLDLQNGLNQYFTLSPSVEVFFRNYVQDQGVRPGENTFSASVEAHGEARVAKLTVFEDSAIERTQQSPPKLAMDVELPKGEVQVGDIVRLKFMLENKGDLPAKNVSVGISYPEVALTLQGESSSYFQELEESAEGEFVFEALKPGRYELNVSVYSGSGGNPVAIIEANID